MKKIILSITTFSVDVLYAQEGENDVDTIINADGGAWYTSPWVWVLGAAIFIIVLVALTRKDNRNND